MKQRRSYVFYRKHQNVIKIPAFATRIDKSNILRRRTGLSTPADQNNFVSSYFTKSNGTELRTRKPLFSSLLEHEAEEYGYKLSRPEQQSTTEKDHNESVCPPKRISYISLFKSTSGPIVTNSSRLLTRNRHNSKQLLPGEASLREQLDKTVLRSTRIATTNACRRYPSLSSRNVLDKYAHLFGLVRAETTSDSDNITNNNVPK